MKLNNLSRLTALLMAIMMLAISCAMAEDSGTDISDMTGSKLTQYNAAAEMISDNKCSLCAETLANRNILTWPVENFDCLHTFLASLTANEIYQLLYDLDQGSSEEYTLGQVYINAHNSHVDATTDELKRDPVICYGYSCYKNPLSVPGPSHAAECPWYQESAYTPVQNGLTPVYGSDGTTIEGYILALKDSNGVLAIVATTDKLDGKYFYFKDVATGLYVAYLHFDDDGTAWIIPLPSEKDLEETPAN